MTTKTFKQIQKKIILPPSGEVPTASDQIETDEFGSIADTIEATRLFLEMAASSVRRSCHETGACTKAKMNRANNRWAVAHHAFIPLLALTAHALQQTIQHRGDPSAAKHWVRLASRLRECCGALFLYGVDFEPAEELYCATIRSDMPEAFSGFWIRERQFAMQPAMAAFFRQFPRDCDAADRRDIRETYDTAEARYHDWHHLSIERSVKNGQSLAALYRAMTGKAHVIGEAQFDELDCQFGVVRGETDRYDFAMQICQTFERIGADLMLGTGLSDSITLSLFDGMRAAIDIFIEWFPVCRAGFLPRLQAG